MAGCVTAATLNLLQNKRMVGWQLETLYRALPTRRPLLESVANYAAIKHAAGRVAVAGSVRVLMRARVW